ncbi:MAG TPA: hypothetical protein VHE35_17525 [Kofleriaceae bacterium]|nr:hypothetical protein [Kofleriaceae bacterium]
MTLANTDTLVARARQLLEEFSKRTPEERFAYWVRLGMVDADGRLTKEYGGTAEAAPESLDAVATTLDDPHDRLVWVLRHSNDTICLDGPTAARLLGTGSVTDLAALLNQAVQRGLIERWTTAEGSPAHIDPVEHRNAAIGARLTDRGRQRVTELETRFEPNLPLEHHIRH